MTPEGQTRDHFDKWYSARFVSMKIVSLLYFGYLVIRRKLTIFICGLLLFLLIIILMYLYNLYKYSYSETAIFLNPIENKYYIKEMQLVFRYNPSGNDKLDMRIWFGDYNDMSGERFSLICSQNMSLYMQDDSSDSVKWLYSKRTNISPDTVSHYYSFNNPKDNFLYEQFEGTIFGGSDYELDFNFHLNLMGREYRSIPINIIISGLSSVNLDTILPNPTEQTDYALVYNFPSIESNKESGRHIVLKATDRNKFHRHQFKLFFFGTISGVLISGLISMLLDTVKSIGKLKYN